MQDPLRKLDAGAYKSLAFEEDVRTDLKLLEVDEKVLGELVEHGVVIKGGADAEAVLVTRHQTFAIKYVETTNLQLLVAPGTGDQDERPDSPAYHDDPDVSATQALRSPAGLQTQVAKMRDVQQRTPLLVTATTKAHLELSEVRPKLHVLHALLSERPYGLPEDGHTCDDDNEQGIDVHGNDGHPDSNRSTHADNGSEQQQQQQQHSDQEQDGQQPVQQAVEEDEEMEARKRRAREDPSTHRHKNKKRRCQGLYSLEELLEHVQASEGQVRAELAAMHALELDGHWRLVDASYLGQLLELCILSAQAEGWPLTALPVQPLCALLSEHDYPPELVAHCLAVHSSSNAADSAAGADGDNASGLEAKQPEPAAAAAACATNGSGTMQQVCCLDTAKVCRYFARKLLTDHHQPDVQAEQDDHPHDSGNGGAMKGAAMPMRLFLARWQAAVPAGMQPDLGALAGEVLITGKGPEAQAQLLPVSSLPTEPCERFARLFSIRPQWEAADLEPYLAGLQAPGQTSGALLLKHARASQPKPDGPVYYTAR